jgi:hypothetical protein
VQQLQRDLSRILAGLKDHEHEEVGLGPIQSSGVRSGPPPAAAAATAAATTTAVAAAAADSTAAASAPRRRQLEVTGAGGFTLDSSTVPELARLVAAQLKEKERDASLSASSTRASSNTDQGHTDTDTDHIERVLAETLNRFGSERAQQAATIPSNQVAPFPLPSSTTMPDQVRGFSKSPLSRSRRTAS